MTTREKDLQKGLRLLRLLHQTTYPQGPGTASQRRNRRRRWRRRGLQILALADQIHPLPDSPTEEPLNLAIQQLQKLTVEDLPTPPTSIPTAQTSTCIPPIWDRLVPRSNPSSDEGCGRDSYKHRKGPMGGSQKNSEGNRRDPQEDQTRTRTRPLVRDAVLQEHKGEGNRV
ncbi:Rev protein [Human immunodeficiency virus 2]|uniref:Protein Rev n=1 Tax=Human immunodeficiency virus 2 TaxID=11709 RepID=Q7SNL9_9HIV2|nr:Rev protein [Human immunodeficiency virus 2]